MKNNDVLEVLVQIVDLQDNYIVLRELEEANDPSSEERSKRTTLVMTLLVEVCTKEESKKGILS